MVPDVITFPVITGCTTFISSIPDSLFLSRIDFWMSGDEPD